MNEFQNMAVPSRDTASIQSRIISKVFSWMSLGLLITAFISWYMIDSMLVLSIISNSILFFGAIIAEFALVIAISKRMQSLNSTVNSLLFILYSALNGVTLSAILFNYTSESIYNTFFITAGSFIALAFFGFVTKKNLSAIGNFLFIGLIGIVIAIVVNIVIASSALSFAISVIGVLIFAGLTAYDTQRIKEMSSSAIDSPEQTQNFVIGGALTLYLDFINLFLFLLRLIGNRN